MATLIRLKRKKSSGNAGIVLAAGEAYYNTADKRLYIGNTDGEDASSTSKKHIAQITPIDAGATTVKFQLGEDESNVYEKRIVAEAIEGTISNAKDATNVTETIAGARITDLFNTSSGKPTSAKSATSASSATKATYASDDTKTTIGTRFSTLADAVEKTNTDLATAETTLQDNIDSLSTTVASNKSTTDSEISKIKDGRTKVSKAALADTATVAQDLQNLSLDSSSDDTVRLTWGNNNSTAFKITAGAISGVIDSAKTVTQNIGAYKIDDIFTGTVAKKAVQLNTKRDLITKLDSTSSAEFDGTTSINIGVSGTLPLANGGTGATTAAGVLTNLGLTATVGELNHVDGVTGNIQTQLDGKQTKISGGASTITSSNLSVNRALISNANGKVAVSDTSAIEIGYLKNAKSNIQTQLDGKAAKSHGNHVPTVETANNAKFLRNDNTWATVTPANIGAAASTHNHDSTYAAKDHTHPTLDAAIKWNEFDK